MSCDFVVIAEAYGFEADRETFAGAREKVWPTSEHDFQAQKFKDKKLQELVRRASTPMLAARMGRSRNPNSFDPRGWLKRSGDSVCCATPLTSAIKTTTVPRNPSNAAQS